VKLDELLGTLTIDQLQDLATVWAPDERLSNSKMALFRSLRAQMTRPDRVRRCLDGADEQGRGIIRRLLRSDRASRSVAVLAASAWARPKSVQETREAVGDLAARGLVMVHAEKRWEPYGSARVTLPDELIEPLREATGIDDRSWSDISGLGGYLALMSGDERVRQMAALGVACDSHTPVDDLVARLAGPAACRQRFEALSSDVRDLVTRALYGYAGLVSVDAVFRALGLELPELRDRALKVWRTELEANLIGTVGDVSLLEYGIDLDGKFVVVFGEAVDALLSASCEATEPPADLVGPDFLLDLAELISCVRESGARLKASGALTVAAAERINAKLNRADLPLIPARELLDLRVACAEKLGLVERGEDSLEVRTAAHQWESRPYERKAAELFELVGVTVPTPRSKHHHAGLCKAARSLLCTLQPSEWRRGGSLANRTLRRYLAGLESSGVRETVLGAVRDAGEYLLPPFPGLAQLYGDLHEAVVMEAYAAGVLDLVVEGGRVAAERLSEFGAVASGRASAPDEPGKLICLPDFEVIILPEGDVMRLRYEVGQFAVREKVEQTTHLRITSERVEEAVVRGLTADDMLGVLHARSDAGDLPQNVEYSIRGWADRVRVAAVERVHLLELGDEGLLNVVAELPGLKPLILRRVSPTALALTAWPSDRKLLAELRRLGVYVR